jgi:hypothetical protein
MGLFLRVGGGLRDFFPFAKELLLGWHGMEGGGGVSHFFWPFY